VSIKRYARKRHVRWLAGEKLYGKIPVFFRKDGRARSAALVSYPFSLYGCNRRANRAVVYYLPGALTGTREKRKRIIRLLIITLRVSVSPPHNTPHSRIQYTEYIGKNDASLFVFHRRSSPKQLQTRVRRNFRADNASRSSYLTTGRVPFITARHDRRQRQPIS